MPRRRGYGRRAPVRRRLVKKSQASEAMKILKDLADLRMGSAATDIAKSRGARLGKQVFSRLRDTNLRQRKGRFPKKGTVYPGRHGGRRFGKGRYRQRYAGGARKRLIGLNQHHQHKFKQHVTGKIISGSMYQVGMDKVTFPLKPYQRSEMKYYPHPIQQKVLLLGNQEIIAGSDNVLSDKVDFESFPTVSDKKLISTVYFPIAAPANFSGIHSFTRMQVDANSEGFSKEQCLGRQNRCAQRFAYDSTASPSEITTSNNNYVGSPDCILTGAFLKMQCQANRNYPVKITVVLARMSTPAALTSNQGLTNDELVECANNMTHIDYDTAEIIFQQSKVLPPCKASTLVTDEFDLGWTGYYKLTQDFRDETALTVKADQGGTYKYGQQGKAKVAGSSISQDQLSNRLCLFIKCKRLGDTQLGMATQTKEFVEVGINKTIGLNQPVNIADSDAYGPAVTGHAGILPTDNYVGEILTSGSFRSKAQLTLNFAVKEGIKSIPTYVNSAANNGKTKILHGSTWDSNYGTLNATMNATD